MWKKQIQAEKAADRARALNDRADKLRQESTSGVVGGGGGGGGGGDGDDDVSLHEDDASHDDDDQGDINARTRKTDVLDVSSPDDHVEGKKKQQQLKKQKLGGQESQENGHGPEINGDDYDSDEIDDVGQGHRGKVSSGVQ